MFDCFISYKVGADDTLAYDFATFLKDDDFTVFIDKKALLPGQKWADELKKSMAQSSYALAFFTTDYLARIEEGNADGQNFIIEELNWAINDNKLIPISIGLPVNEIEGKCTHWVNGLKGLQFLYFEDKNAVDNQTILNQINKLIRLHQKTNANKFSFVASSDTSQLTSEQAYFKQHSTWSAAEAFKYKEVLENKFLKAPLDYVVLARFYLTGRFGVKISPEVAHEHLLIASRSDCREAFYELGLLYEATDTIYGDNEDKAVQYYTAAHDSGDIRATFRLALLFDDNVENINSPTSFLKKKYAIEHANQFASVIFSKESSYSELTTIEKYAYCQMQLHANSNESSYATAITEMNELASSGLINAAYWLGEFYSQPERASNHISNALNFLHAAEEQGCVDARELIASINLEEEYSDLSFEQNIQFGIKKHQENIRLNFYDSAYALAWVCRQQAKVREYITQDEEISFLKKAAAFGHKNCVDMLNEACNDQIDFYKQKKPIEETFALFEDCTAILKSLHTSDPERWNEVYASMLRNLAISYYSVDHNAEAMSLFEECLAIYKSMHTSDPRRWADAFANSLLNMAISYDKAGKAPVARALREECLPIYKSLHESDPGRWAEDYARLLGNLKYSLDKTEELDRREECLAIYKSLNISDPERWAEDYAHSLSVLAYSYNKAGRSTEALALGEECLPIYKSLYASDPKRWAKSYPNSLHNLANSYDKVGRPTEALALRKECLHIYKSLHASDPGRWAVDYANSLANLANSYVYAGQTTDGMSLREECWTIRKSLYAKDPKKWAGDYADSLFDLANSYSYFSRKAEARSLYEECWPIYKSLYASDSKRWAEAYAKFLGYMAFYVGCPAELGLREERNAIYKLLYSSEPERWAEDYATSLFHVANRYHNVGRADEARSLQEECCTIRKFLCESDPKRWAKDYTLALFLLASSYDEAGRATVALALREEHLAIYKSLYASDPELWAVDYANSLRDMACSYEIAGRKTEAADLRSIYESL
jgi:hypothetical protein